MQSRSFLTKRSFRPGAVLARSRSYAAVGTLLVSVCIASIQAVQPAYSESQVAIVQLAAQHRFLSAPHKVYGKEGVYYEVCNQSDKPSAFYWKDAGFGVDDFNRLQPTLCARKANFFGTEITRATSDVRFAQGTLAYVENWRSCIHLMGAIDTCKSTYASDIYDAYAEMFLFSQDPDENNISIEEVRFAVYFDREKGVGDFNLTRRTAAKRDDYLFVVLLNPKANKEQIENLLKGQKIRYEISKFIDIKQKLKLDSTNVLFDEIEDSSLVISSSEFAESDYSLNFLTFNNIEKVGTRFALIATSGSNIRYRMNINTSN